MVFKIATREDPGQTASDLRLHCLSRRFCHVTSVQNFRIFNFEHFPISVLEEILVIRL